MTTEKIVETIKQCGQSIIDNAESIAGDYKFQTYLDIGIKIPVIDEEMPSINISAEFLPESYIEAKKG